MNDKVKVTFWSDKDNISTQVSGILAAYDSTGRLTDISIKQVNSTNGVTAEVRFDENYTYKAFIWKSLTTLSPVVLDESLDTEKHTTLLFKEDCFAEVFN